MTINQILLILTALETPEWMVEQINNDKPYGLMAALRSLAESAIYDPGETGSSVIYGNGGVARYTIDRNGNLRLHANSVPPGKLEIAVRLGVIPT
jgi:hypothetical protein